jgi:hypothetical protein
MVEVQVGAAVVAVVEIIKQLVPNSVVRGLVTIVVAGVLGGLAGLAELQGLNVAEGIVVGLAAAGIVKLGKVVAAK